MKRNKTEHINVLVEQILKDIAKQGENYKHLIIAEWEQLLGVTVTNATQKIYIKDNKLYIHLNSPVIKQEIIFLREKILIHMNTKFPQARLREIIFK